jgi:hypothetical protein
MNSTERYPCPCCGYCTYFLPADGTMQVCPVCFWEDAPGQYQYNNSNRVSLTVAQNNFSASGVSEPVYSDIVRDPLPEEARSPGWLSISDIKTKIVEMVQLAFEDVRLGNGISLHQADVVDDYGTRAEFDAAKLHDPETRWQQIPTSKIERFCGSMTFLDSEGFRFYLPAFIIYGLNTFNPDFGSMEADGVLFAAESYSDSHKDNFAILNTEQLRAVASFLKFTSLYVEKFDAVRANKSLKNGMKQWLPDYLFLA